MTSNNEFADWYEPGSVIPVCHPVPHCTATIEFIDVETIEWTVIDHKNERELTERFNYESDFGDAGLKMRPGQEETNNE